jgi:hypothetical protein
MTPEQRKAARERVQKAYKAPWVQGDLWAPWLLSLQVAIRKYLETKDTDAMGDTLDFIAHARTDLPAALDEIDRLHNALLEIGKLTRWVGWVEEAHPSGGEDMRAIKRIVEKSVGGEFSEYT